MNKSWKPACFHPTDLIFLSQDTCWRIEAGYNHVSAAYNLHNHAMVWKLHFISEVNLDFIQLSGADALVSRLREGGKEIDLKYTGRLEATDLAELWNIPCPKTTLHRIILNQRMITVL